MAKKLIQLQQRNDDNGREIRCVFHEKYTDGSIIIERDPSKFEEIILTNDEMFVTKFYSPNEKEKQELVNLINENSSEEESGEKRLVISGTEILFHMLKFTDIEFTEDDKELFEQIVESPSRLLNLINMELNKMLFEIISDQQLLRKSVESIPNEIASNIVETIELEQKIELQKEELAKAEIERQERIKKANDLKRQLAELEID